MPNIPKQQFVNSLLARYGQLRKVQSGNTLFQTGDGTYFYIRYSKIHDNRKCFFGLERKVMLPLKKEGGYICFICQALDKVFIIPIKQLLPLLAQSKTAYDDSYKMQLYLEESDSWLSVPKKGRYDISKYSNHFPELRQTVLPREESDEIFEAKSNFTHEQIQGMMVKIGKLLGYDVWIPMADRKKMVGGEKIGKSCVPRLELVAPARTISVIQAVDVTWMRRGTFVPVAFFEIEHSTSIYSGLLRLNDIIIDYTIPAAGIVSFEKRRVLFEREIARRTFQNSGLNEICRFYNYRYVHTWYTQLQAYKNNLARIGDKFLK